MLLLDFKSSLIIVFLCISMYGELSMQIIYGVMFLPNYK